VTYGPLAYGLLTGAISADTVYAQGDFRPEEARMFGPGNLEKSLRVVEAMKPIAERLGITVAQLALAWNIHQPGVTAAIAGSRDPAHVRSNAAAGDIELDDETLVELEAILPLGPPQS
jgi:aryl-alcohol dehydrogenase-like predicted oxidoreductase